MNRFLYKIQQVTKKKFILYSALFIFSFTSVLFTFYNYSLYDKPIVKVTQTNLINVENETDSYNNKDTISTQKLVAQLKNGPHKDQFIHLTNTYSISKAYDQAYTVGNDLFVKIDKETLNNKTLSGDILNVKRDKYTIIVAWIFTFALLFVGKRQGFLAILSLLVNIILLTIAIEINVQTNFHLLILSGILALLFTIISLLIVNGRNEKSYAAIIATILGTVTSLAITLMVIQLTSSRGLHYEEMQFLTRPYKLVFIAGLFIGSLGAVMDVAITMSSSIFEIQKRNPTISMKALKASAIDVGRDIMGTMTSILFFAYISGSIPMLILYFKNGNTLGFTLSMNLSLELARAISGGIGIVLTIPIGLYISIYFLKRKQAKL